MAYKEPLNQGLTALPALILMVKITADYGAGFSQIEPAS